ncbi:acyltransferase [Pelotomaculum propionicicum]|uniref:Putative acetyltransferase n=1 Tax=Pelotomaculum propionicicum TaxID=258475 RepID=A0A4Y7RLN2_9FIRM|nr:acyltransferase [Pelotomaculum propionicicum]TEB09885.1 putative acetyltransferase [Pelotomaculum propionicicum]
MIRWIYCLSRSLKSSYYTFLMKRLLNSVGRDTTFEGYVDVPLSNKVIIGDECYISAGVSFVVTKSGKLTIGNRVFIGRGSILASDLSVTIGDNTMLAEYVSVIDADHVIKRNGIPIRDQGLNPAPVHIGGDVWVGRGCALLKGVTIGDGAVIGANSVVTGDIPPFSVAYGSPAKVQKYR